MQQVNRSSITDDTRILWVSPLPPPANLIRFYPIEWTVVEWQIKRTRDSISHIIHGSKDRLLVVVGPCSIHDPAAALDYARYLKEERDKHKETLEIVMRTYFEKPRTTVGWKWLINDPYLNESFSINVGLRIARSLLMDINRLWVPVGTEFLDTISPQYLADLISWWAIGARTTESQVHRELVSWLSCPIWFKNGTDGNVQIAVDAMKSSRESHHFLWTSKSGQISMVQTRWNTDTHIILRWMNTGTNYDRGSIAQAVNKLRKAWVPDRIMIDASHGNSQKNYRNQAKVIEDVVGQIRWWSRDILWVMIESNLVEWSQPYTPGKTNPDSLTYWQSITDQCVGLDETSRLLAHLSDGVKFTRE